MGRPATQGGLGPLIAIVATGWLVLIGLHYFELQVMNLLWLAYLLVWLASWAWVGISTVALLVALIRRQRVAAVIAMVVLAPATGVAVWVADWPTVFVQTQFWLHRGALNDLADRQHELAQRRNVDWDSSSPVPWRLRLLASDGRAYSRPGYLYLKTWEDWRAENGIGIAYFPQQPGPDAPQQPDAGVGISTAAGDVGRPTRHLGDGWWLIA